MYDALGQVLKEARESVDTGVSLRYVATKADIDVSRLSMIERGLIVQAPDKLDQILAGYAAVTGIPVDELLERWGAEVRRRNRAARRRPPRANSRA